ncbi:MAG: hypothetical protein WA635_11685 [Gallionella sp.]
MPHIHPVLSRSWLMGALVFSLAACESPAPPKADTPSLEQRMFELERRVEMLEARPTVKPPYRSKAEIQENIRALEDERAKLLTHYLPEHPDIKDIVRQLEILNSQLKMLE